MATIKQYRPAFVSGFENQTVKFNSLEELFNIEFVDNFKFHIFETKINNPDFHRFSISIQNGHKILMAEYKQGTEWWVVGFIEGGDDIIKELPKWVAKEKS